MTARPQTTALPHALRHLRARRRPVVALLATTVVTAATLVALPLVTGAQAAVSYSPYGHADLTRSSTGMRVTGWTVDPSSQTRALSVYTTLDGKRSVTVTASLARTDVARAHPGAGANHGFSFIVPASEGSHTVCAYARNIYHGADTRLSCRTATLDYGPQGAVDYVHAGHGGFWVKGWFVDGNAWTTSVPVTVSLDGRSTQTLADKASTEVPATWPVHGTLHGLSLYLPATQGTHRVCITARNLGAGSDNSYGCRTVVLDERPTGHVDFVGQSAGKLRVRGWTYDVDQRTTPLSVLLTIDGQTTALTANGVRTDVARAHSGVGNYHGFDVSRTLAEGTHTVAVVARNVDLGAGNRTLASTSVRLNFTPSVYLASLTPSDHTVRAQGWAVDPDTGRPIAVRLTVDGHTARTVTADHAGPHGAKYAGRNFGDYVTTVSGTHTICATALNTLYGTHNSVPSCRQITLALSPHGHYDSATRVTGSNAIRITGWGFDWDTTHAVPIAVLLDGRQLPNLSAGASRTDVARAYPGAGTLHGFSATLAVSEGEHRICTAVRNVGGGRDLALGCKVVIAVHPVVPGMPTAVKATAGYGSATVSWTPPASDGGAPVTSYIVHAYPGIHETIVSASSTHATVSGLSPKSRYNFRVWAHNLKGNSVASAYSPTITTAAGPAPQRSPAPVATSRYIRNIRSGTSAELATMRAEGAADARANPSNHRYLVLLDIGGQDYYDNGVVLSATTRFVSNSVLVRAVDAYLDGYRSAQHSVAPVTIALGTNNDMDVSYNSGKQWAQKVVAPIAAHAAGWSGIAIAGANDIEPGFRAGYTATRSWLSGYLAGTSRPFIFNGSADGCAWTTTNRGCNNGWSMARLHDMAAGASPSRIVNLPQIYNTTMAAQWKYISLTGVVNHHARINFGGPLTELTACKQSRSCGSLSGYTAWQTLWRYLQSDSRVRQTSMPYATDLRIDW